MNFSLKGKKILVTGASSGIGCCTAKILHQSGAEVYITGRNKERTYETLKDINGEEKQMIVADLTSEEEQMELVQKLPEIDGIVHSAGIVKTLPFKFINKTDLESVNKTNYEAPVLLTQKLVKNKKIRNGGSIVFISSIANQIALKGNGIYSGTKGALISMSRVIALELASLKIRSNCVCPGMVRTAMAEQTENSVSKEAMAEHEKLYPLGFGNPEDVAYAVQYLLSDASRWMTGNIITIDGGFTIQ